MDLYDYQVRMCNFITFRAHCEGQSSSCAGSTHRAPRTLFQSARRSQRCAWASGPGSGSHTSTGIGMKGDLFIAQYNYLPSGTWTTNVIAEKHKSLVSMPLFIQRNITSNDLIKMKMHI